MVQSIIDGKHYDTDTAEKLSEGETWTEEQTLYRTAKGNFFLLCSFGVIKPITERQAHQWCEEHYKPKIINRFWPGTIEDA